MTDVASKQKGVEQEPAQQIDASDHGHQSVRPPDTQVSEMTGTSQSPISFGSGLRRVMSYLFNRSRDVAAVITIITAVSVWLAGLYALLVTPGPRLDKTLPLAVGDTVMKACILSNNGASFEENIWVTLRAEPKEQYLLSFKGAEGFARLREDNDRNKLIAESEVVPINSGTTRLEVERLAPGQTITVTVQHLLSTTVSCDVIGSTGSIQVSGIRILGLVDYAVIFGSFVVAVILAIFTIEVVRRFREAKRSQTQDKGVPTGRAGGS